MVINLNSIKELSPDKLRNQRVLLRLDLDVPLSETGEVVEDFRLKRCLPTLQYLIASGAKVIILGHLGKDGSKSLAPVAKWFEQSASIKLEFKKDLEDSGLDKVIMLENLRSWSGEKANDPNFAKQLALLGDLYVNDSFATCHRQHASIVGLPQLLPAYAGLNLIKEVEHLSAVFDPPAPFLFILGGAKFETKIPLLEKFLSLTDNIFIGGALANSFFKALNYEVGISTVDDHSNLIKPFLSLSQTKIILPIDVIVERAGKSSVKLVQEVLPDENILDVGPESIKRLASLINQAKFILWNGPLGHFERGYRGATNQLAQLIASSGAESVVGGGDTITAIQALDLFDQFSFVSTGGGAMLDFLSRGTLPGIEALIKN